MARWAAMPVWRPLREQRIEWRDGEYTLSLEQVEILRATQRLRELARQIAPPEVIHLEGIRRDGTRCRIPVVRRPSFRKNYMWRDLEATAGYDPETPEGRAEWRRVRRICARIARRWDHEEVLVNAQIARSEQQRCSFTTTRDVRISRVRARARESRPSRRVRGGPKGDRPRSADEDEADPVRREAAA
jgi:hypothetical protein